MPQNFHTTVTGWLLQPSIAWADRPGTRAREFGLERWRARDKTSIFGSRAAKPRTVMSADGTAAANWLRGGVKAVTREYDALPMHYLSAPLAGVRTTCRDADDRTH